MPDFMELVGYDVLHVTGSLKIPSLLLGAKMIDGELFPIIQYLAPHGEPYSVKSRPYWLQLTQVVEPSEIVVSDRMPKNES